jgi:hypothetical protein
MTAHSNISISQVPSMWEGTATYENDLFYFQPKQEMTVQDIRFLLNRKCKALRAKLETNLTPGYQSRWQNQLELYESILKHLPLQ